MSKFNTDYVKSPCKNCISRCTPDCYKICFAYRIYKINLKKANEERRKQRSKISDLLKRL